MMISKQTILLTVISITTATAAVELTTACLIESDVLSDNSMLTKLSEAVVRESPIRTNDTITVTYSSTTDFSIACIDAGGKYITYDFDFSCKDADDSDISGKIVGNPVCTGMSCTEDDIKALERVLEDEIEYVGESLDGVTCSDGFSASGASLTLGASIVAVVYYLL